MKTLSYDGVAAVTDDAIADAVMDFAIAVARFNRYEQVTIPVVLADVHEELTLMLGPTIHISALTLSNVAGIGIEGADVVAAALRDRTRAITDPLRAAQTFEALGEFEESVAPGR